jgi:hypothetical protein
MTVILSFKSVDRGLSRLSKGRHSVYANVYDCKQVDLLTRVIVNLPNVVEIEELKVQVYEAPRIFW